MVEWVCPVAVSLVLVLCRSFVVVGAVSIFIMSSSTGNFECSCGKSFGSRNSLRKHSESKRHGGTLPETGKLKCPMTECQHR